MLVAPSKAPPKIVTKLDDVKRIVELVYANKDKAYTFDFETLATNPVRLKKAGLGIAWGPEDDEASYIVTLHEDHPYLDYDKALSVLQPMFEDPDLTAIAHNYLFDASILAADGVNLHTNFYDTMVMAWLLNTARRVGLKPLVKEEFEYEMRELTEFAPKITVDWDPDKIFALHQVDIDILSAYGVDDVTWTYRLWMNLLTDLKQDAKLDKIYHELYQEFLTVLVYMQVDGITVDKDLLYSMAEQAGNEIEQLQKELYRIRPGADFQVEGIERWTAADIDVQRKLIPALQDKWKDRKTLRPILYDNPSLAHKVFSPNSQAQLNQILFRELKLRPIGDKGANGHYSVDADSLVKLSRQDESGFVKHLMRYRTLGKLHGTYLLGLPPMIDKDGRLRTSFRATLQTGRLSSSSPNLQNIVNSQDFPVRKAFVPAKGKNLVVVDYSQIELRVLTQFSGDGGMIQDFKAGIDPHSSTAKTIFDLDVPASEIKGNPQLKTYRQIGKTTNFATVYQAGPRTVADQVAKATDGEVTPSPDEAAQWIDAFFEARPGVKRYIRQQERRAEQEGLVRTLLGRPRHLPDALSSDMRSRGPAMRQAVNTPIQGSAADIIALAMRNITRRFVELGWWRTKAWLLLQVHDELVFECDPDITDELIEVVKHEMEHAVTLVVPLEAEPTVADNWYEAK